MIDALQILMLAVRSFFDNTKVTGNETNAFEIIVHHDTT